MELCACGSQNAYTNCCHKYISQQENPLTAEQLMRSRYVAYVKCEIEYILDTTHFSTRNQYNAASIEDWARTSHWMGLQIVSCKQGLQSDDIGFVEFKAHYKDPNNISHVHHEYSSFKKEANKWYFVKGEVF